MKLDLHDITVGCELELGDIDTKIEIPEKLGVWDYRDGSIMNSNGTANDPLKKLNRYGGEIQVAYDNSCFALAEKVMKIYELFPEVNFNFTTNLHVHIGLKGLKQDLGALQRITQYIDYYGASMLETVDRIPIPEREDFDSKKAFKGAWKRYLRRKRSHHTIPTDEALDRMYEAKTVEDFFKAFAPLDKNGKPQYHLVARPCINLLQLRSPSETIEFRCFTMSPKFKKMLSAFEFCRATIKAALSERQLTPKEILEKNDFRFQKFWRYKYHKDVIFQLTNVRHNSRQQVEKNYKRLIADGTISKKDIR